MANRWILAIASSIAAAAVTLALVVAFSHFNQPEKVYQTASLTAVDSNPGNGNAEGIRVHGHWKIDVRDRNGALVEQLVFENELNSFGPETLAKLLARETAIKKWQVNVVGGICLDRDTGKPSQCAILEETTPGQPAGHIVHTLTVGRLGSKAEGNPRVVLSGSVVAQNDASVTSVLVYTDLKQFSSKALAGRGVAIKEGQSVNVTVTYTFS